MSIFSYFFKDPVQEACQQFTDHLEDSPAPALSEQTRQQLTAHQQEHAEVEATQAMGTLKDFHLRLLKDFCPPWATHHRYGRAEIIRFAQMLPHAGASLNDKLDLTMTLDEIMQLWVGNNLRHYLPEEPFTTEQVKAIAQHLHFYSVPNCAIILQRLYGPLSQAKLMLFFDFIRDYSITDAWLNDLFASSFHIDDIIVTLHRALFTGALTQRFHHVQEAVEIAQKFYAKSWPIQDIA